MVNNQRYPFAWSIQEVEDPSDDRTCDVCGDKPAVVEGMIFQQTRVDPAEWMGFCEDHRGEDEV